MALAELADNSPLPPKTKEVVRAVRNRMSAFSMRNLRHSRREITTGLTPPIDASTEDVAEPIEYPGRTVQERLAIMAYVRGVPVRDITELLGVNYKRLMQLAEQYAQDGDE